MNDDKQERELICNSFESSLQHLIECFEVYDKVKNIETELIELREHIYEYCFSDYCIDLMCNFKDIIDALNHKDEIDVINYLTLIFNEELYKKLLKNLNNNKNPYSIYSILVSEYWKKYLFERISNNLIYIDNPKVNLRNRIIEIQCNKNIKLCNEIIKEYYEIALRHSKVSYEELQFCKELLNLIDKERKYEIEIVIEK